MLRRTAARTSALLLLLLLPIRASSAEPARGETVRESTRTSWDMLGALEAAGSLPGGAALVYRGGYGETRAGIHLPMPGSVSAPVEIPPGARLTFGFAFHAAAFMTETPELAEPGRVRVTFTAADGTQHVLFERRVDVREQQGDRRWFDERVDLAPLAGQKGRLTITVLNDGDADKAKGTNVYFSAPRIVQSAARAPGESNLLLITVDCLRADHVGAYGHPKPTTPTIDRLAAQGVRFANAFANAPMTLPSIPQLFTSTVFPTKDLETFVEPIAKAGIPSVAVVNNAWIPLWLSQGKHAEPPGTFDAMISGDLDAKAISDRAIAWLERHRDDRFVLYLHYLDAHTPTKPPKEYVARFADPSYAGKIGDTFTHPEDAEASRFDAADRAKVAAIYDAAIRYVDDQIGRVLETLEKQGELERTVVVVTADHGEELWDHGRFFHGQTLYDEQLHIPLVVRAPGIAAGTVVERPVRMIDLAPSLLEWTGLERPKTFEGRPLSQVIAAPTAPGDDLVATATQAQFPTRYALRTDDAKLIESLDTGSRELFAIRTDPRETTNLAAERPDEVAKLEARLWAARAPLRQRGYQVKVAGPQSGGAKVELRLVSQPRSGTFLTIDRTAASGAPRLVLSTDGANLTLRADVDAGGTGLRFDRLLSPRNIARDDKVAFEVLVDGKPAGHAVLALGKDGKAASGDIVDLADTTLTSDTEPGCAASERGVRVCVWRYPGEHIAAMPEISDPAVREKLRALGYLQ